MDLNYYEIEVNKVFANDYLREKYKIDGHYISIQFHTRSKSAIRAILRINKEKSIKSSYFDNKQEAKRKCLKKALVYFDELERKIEKEKKILIRRKTIKKSLFGFFIFIGYLFLALLYYVFNFKINFFLSTLSIYSFFVSPICFMNYEIGKCIAERVLVRRSLITDNVYYKTLRYLYSEELLLFKNAEDPKPNDNLLEAVVTKELVLRRRDLERSRYNSYTLPERLTVGVKKFGETFLISVISYELDGKKKMYYNPDVPQDYIKLEHSPKYKVFSRYGFHYVKKRFIVNHNLKNWEWYFCILSIYKNYFEAFLLSFTNYYDKDNVKNGFDNFKIKSTNVIKQVKK